MGFSASLRWLFPLALATTGLLLGSANRPAAAMPFTGELQPRTAGTPAPTGTGYSFIIVDTTARTLNFKTEWSGLNGTVVSSHIHAQGGVPSYQYPSGANWAVALNMTAAGAGFPTTTSGSYTRNYGITDLGSVYIRQENGLAGTVTTFTTAQRQLAFDNLVTYLGSGNAYYDLHTAGNPAGSLGNFFVPVPGPLPLSGAAAAYGFSRKLRKRIQRAPGNRASALPRV